MTVSWVEVVVPLSALSRRNKKKVRLSVVLTRPVWEEDEVRPCLSQPQTAVTCH